MRLFIRKVKPKERTTKPARWSGNIPKEDLEKMQRILVVHTAFLGDVVLLTALIQAIHKFFPKVVIDALVIPQNKGVLENNPAIGQIFTFDKRNKKERKKSFQALLEKIRSQQYDLAITPHRSLTTARLLKTAQIPWRIGYSRRFFSFLYFNIRVKFRHGLFEIERHLDLLRPLLPNGKQLEMMPENFPTALFPNKDHFSKAEMLLSSLEIYSDKVSKSRKTVVALAPGSVWFTKKWPTDYFQKLAMLLIKEGMGVVVIGGPEDREIAEEVAAHQPGAIAVAGKTNLIESAALIQKTKLVITNDSAPLHIANAMDTPVLAIFGATSPKFGFGPYRSKDALMEKTDLYCHPCRTHGSARCPQNHFRCMRDILPEQVFERAMRMLAKIQA